MSLLWTPFPRPLLLTCQSYLKRLPPFHGWVSPGLLDWVGSSGLAGIASYSCVPSSWVQGLLGRGLSTVLTDKAGLTLPPYLPWAPL